MRDSTKDCRTWMAETTMPASTLFRGGAIAIIDAKNPISTAAVRRAAAATAAVLVAAEAAGVPTFQQCRAAGSAQWSPLSVEKEKSRPHLKKTRQRILKLEKRRLGL
ncbi:unnamed protein product [Cuscuta campestris]|uniref:Uncharacterized protein n=1 Tax=Cuscuta campestris TaxID=132261 RepID=A0A484M6A7_9ASTE|nr:unnamed protein product [Cuscuta campestris]